MTADRLIPLLLTLAWLAPLAGAVATWVMGRIVVDRGCRLPAWVAVGVMAVSLNLAMAAGLARWSYKLQASGATTWGFIPNYDKLSGTYYTLGEFGSLSLSIDYYIDGLTLLMFGVVTLIAMCVHVYAVAYMDGERGRGGAGDEEQFSPSPASPDPPPPLVRFFTTLQFFTFTMLGLVLAGNLLQVFVFWELVGIASYLLIGFYYDRAYATAAATKAFVMNRVGDAGFLVGIVILWTAFGSVRFVEEPVIVFQSAAIIYADAPGLFDFGFSLTGIPVESWIHLYDRDPSQLLVRRFDGIESVVPLWWLVVAGLCLFAGCVGKSAQLPLSTWLPDAMAGPTPVSALVHSATMVAAGVYLVARVYPLFLPEVLIVIAYVGAFTLVYGATCALVQTDLKRILAWSTVSQLGYMMLAMGVGGREAGLFHLVTHAFFKSLLFLAAGSVIVACHHVQDVSRLGGLRKRMPITAYTSLVGVIAICGLAIPVWQPFGEAIAFSGYHSKDSILAAALGFAKQNPQHALLFALPLVTAGLTAFYMFRFWLLAFVGKPRDEELHRSVRESSPLMTVPLVVLAAFAAFVAIGGEEGLLFETIAGPLPQAINVGDLWIEAPALEAVQARAEAHYAASILGLLLAVVGTGLALAAYGAGLLDGHRTAAFFGPVRGFLFDGWRLDRVHNALFVAPLALLAYCGTLFDRFVLDGLLHGTGRMTIALARFDRQFDERVVDGFVNRLADVTCDAGRALRHVQTGQLRQYVMALAAAAVALFALAVVLVPKG